MPTQTSVRSALIRKTAPRSLVVVPGGAIGADGETMTVRLFSRRPLDELETVHVDPDSHTSVVLMRILLAQRTGRIPRVGISRELVDGSFDHRFQHFLSLHFRDGRPCQAP